MIRGSVLVQLLVTRMHSSGLRTARGSNCPRGVVSASVHAWIHSPGVGLVTSLGVGLETPHGCGPGDPPGVGLGTPLGLGLETPLARPLNFPPGCGPGDPPGDLLQGMLGYHPSPGDLLQGMLGYHLQCMLGYQPPCEQNHRHL